MQWTILLPTRTCSIIIKLFHMAYKFGLETIVQKLRLEKEKCSFPSIKQGSKTPICSVYNKKITMSKWNNRQWNYHTILSYIYIYIYIPIRKKKGIFDIIQDYGNKSRFKRIFSQRLGLYWNGFIISLPYIYHLVPLALSPSSLDPCSNVIHNITKLQCMQW